MSDTRSPLSYPLRSSHSSDLCHWANSAATLIKSLLFFFVSIELPIPAVAKSVCHRCRRRVFPPYLGLPIPIQAGVGKTLRHWCLFSSEFEGVARGKNLKVKGVRLLINETKLFTLSILAPWKAHLVQSMMTTLVPIGAVRSY